MHSDSLAGDVIKGAAAGALAVWVMDRVDWFIWSRQPYEVRRRIEDVRPGAMDPAHVLANRAAEAFGRDLLPVQPHPVGIATHYALAVLPTVLYALLRRRVSGVAAGAGTVFGLGLFLAQDEALNSILGLSAPQRTYPWQAHARGLLAHLVLGATAEAALRVLSGAPRR
ncbi:MAG: DUF1440 domain-containing protein [Pseudomonadota bacterium]|nr:DUF1440 domain-containing protein [Pseudomonadota bacterium]